jgi:hypothetical protein
MTELSHQAVFPKVGARDFVFGLKEPHLEHPFPDVSFLTVYFEFATNIGPASGIARLVYEDVAWKAFTVFTLLEGVQDHPQRVGAHRARGTHNDKLSYYERRDEEGEHNGLALAAQLNSFGVRSLVIDRQKRVGDNWRLRYR